MNNRVSIDKIDSKWFAHVTSYDSLTFGDYKDEITLVIKANTYSELLIKLSEKEVFDLINKNV